MVTKKAPASLALSFEFERATKNTYRFAETADEDGNTVVGTLYVQKSALDGVADGTTITVTITVD